MVPAIAHFAIGRFVGRDITTLCRKRWPARWNWAGSRLAKPGHGRQQAIRNSAHRAWLGSDLGAIRTAAAHDADNDLINRSRRFVMDGDKPDFVIIIAATQRCKSLETGMAL